MSMKLISLACFINIALFAQLISVRWSNELVLSIWVGSIVPIVTVAGCGALASPGVMRFAIFFALCWLYVSYILCVSKLSRVKTVGRVHQLLSLFQIMVMYMVLYLLLIFSYYFRNCVKKNHKFSEIVLTRSSRGSHILKTLVKQKTEIMDTNQTHISETEVVLSPKVRVGPA